MEWVRFGFCTLFIVLGLVTILISILGVYQFKFVLNRMHATAIIDTLGIFFILLGLMIANGLSWDLAKLALIVVILWITSPITSHIVAEFELMIHKDEVEKTLDHNKREDNDGNS